MSFGPGGVGGSSPAGFPSTAGGFGRQSLFVVARLLSVSWKSRAAGRDSLAAGGGLLRVDGAQPPVAGQTPAVEAGEEAAGR